MKLPTFFAVGIIQGNTASEKLNRNIVQTVGTQSKNQTEEAEDYDKRPRCKDCVQYAASSGIDISSLPPPPHILAAVIKDPATFMAALRLTNKQINDIETATKGQVENHIWMCRRKGMITASKFRTVILYMERERKLQFKADVKGVLRQVCQFAKASYWCRGRVLEPVAIDSYMSRHQTECHRGVTGRECGLFVDKQNPFLGASPDYVVECPKCGTGLLEVKCPYSGVSATPSYKTVGYLEKSVDCHGDSQLNRDHPHYEQIQGQLGVSGYAWCDLYVYSEHGQHLERFTLDTNYWHYMVENLKLFYQTYMLPELMNPKEAAQGKKDLMALEML